MASEFLFNPQTEFEIVEENSSGIGPTQTIVFQILGKDVKIDNTDVSNW
jgi:hypothetical protein